MELLIGGEFSLIGQLKKGYPFRHPQGYVSFSVFGSKLLLLSTVLSKRTSIKKSSVVASCPKIVSKDSHNLILKVKLSAGCPKIRSLNFCLPQNLFGLNDLFFSKQTPTEIQRNLSFPVCRHPEIVRHQYIYQFSKNLLTCFFQDNEKLILI